MTKEHKLSLFRGIAVPVEEASHVTTRILGEGIAGDEGQWQLPLNDLRDSIDRLVQKPGLSLTDTRPPKTSAEYFQCICACGDELGASYYAVRHNAHSGAKETSLIIHFSVESSRVYVDGRDFLYTCFQFWDRDGAGFLPIQRKTLIRLFGKRIVLYFDKTASSRDQNYRIALCDLACQDLQVVRSHAKNRIIIRGRHGVVFSSALLIKVPLLPAEIIKVDAPREFDFRPQLTLDDFLRGRLNPNA